MSEPRRPIIVVAAVVLLVGLTSTAVLSPDMWAAFWPAFWANAMAGTVLAAVLAWLLRKHWWASASVRYSVVGSEEGEWVEVLVFNDGPISFMHPVYWSFLVPESTKVLENKPVATWKKSTPMIDDVRYTCYSSSVKTLYSGRANLIFRFRLEATSDINKCRYQVSTEFGTYPRHSQESSGTAQVQPM